MRSSVRAQSALEYMMIIALTLVIIVPTTYLFFSYSSESAVEVVDAQLVQVGRTIINSAETVYYSGSGSKLQIEVTIPDNVNSIYIIDNRELIFNVTTSIGESEAVFFSDVNISSESCLEERCSLEELASIGLKKIRVQSINNGKQVLISKA